MALTATIFNFDIDLADNASGDMDEFYFGLFGALRF